MSYHLLLLTTVSPIQVNFQNHVVPPSTLDDNMPHSSQFSEPCREVANILIHVLHLTTDWVVQVFFGVLIGSMSLGHAFPNLETFSNARAAAVKVFEIMDLHPVIDITSPAGKTPETLSGVIEFKDVYFRYPARPEVQVLCAQKAQQIYGWVRKMDSG